MMASRSGTQMETFPTGSVRSIGMPVGGIRFSGVYIFCDCEPINSYRYLGDLKGKFTLNPQYTVLRDDMLKKCVKHYDNANGIILHLVLGGKDTAEAIKF